MRQEVWLYSSQPRSAWSVRLLRSHSSLSLSLSVRRTQVSSWLEGLLGQARAGEESAMQRANTDSEPRGRIGGR